jgi:hypothetical protein
MHKTEWLWRMLALLHLKPVEADSTLVKPRWSAGLEAAKRKPSVH